MAIVKYIEKNVITALEEEFIWDVVKRMKDKNTGSVVIVKQEKDGPVPISILTDRGLLKKIVSNNLDMRATKIKDLSMSSLISIKEDEGVRATIKILETNQIRRAPVINKNNKLIGIITLDDLLVLLLDELHQLISVIKGQASHNKQQESRLDNTLKESFPASDPSSPTSLIGASGTD